MERIDSHIKKNEYSRMYLLYGDNDYMKKMYRNRLKYALMPEDDGMNCLKCSSDDINIDEVISFAQTMPFFADRRLIIIEDSTLFSEANDFVDFYDSFPDSTYIIFVERKVDKRSRMYKFVKENGLAVEMKELGEDRLSDFVASRFATAGLSIRKSDAMYFITRTGIDMNVIKNECEKVIAYIGNRTLREVRREDIEAICSVNIEDKIFDMLDNIANGNKDEAMKKYSDLIELREPPLKILRLIYRHFNLLLLVKEGSSMGMDDKTISAKAKIPSFAIRKYKNQSQKYSKKQLMDIIKRCVEYDESFKKGNISDQIAVDILVCTL